jgi:hypothetical protein
MLKRTALLLCLLIPVLLSAQVKRSPGKTTYYINPRKGNDANTGTSSALAWRSFKNISKYIFTKGDRIEILPGTYNSAFVLHAVGDSLSPVTVKFTYGHYDLFPAYREKLNISNTNDAPNVPKAIAILCRQSRFVHFDGAFAELTMRGKMIEAFIDHSDHISVSGFTFDYKRPTVSELKVLSANEQFAEVLVHQDSKYTIKDSVLTWQGEGWKVKPSGYWQVFDSAAGTLNRIDFPVAGFKYVNMPHNHVRIYYPENPGFKEGLVYQNRDITRDCAGIFIQRSKDILLSEVNIRFMHGMGIVSQFSENLLFDNLQVAPDNKSGRNCAAWADILHFSGCRGQIQVRKSVLSAANDDAINVHGTFLRIVATPRNNQLLLRFMHNQTYGFEPFQAGDSISLVHAASLLPFHFNVVKSVAKVNEKDYLVTLTDTLITKNIQPGDVVQNNTWMPEVWIHDNVITTIPTRGILVTTSRKAIIEHNVIKKTAGSAILVADDAGSWYESGAITDLTIQSNEITYVGSPAINIHPENKTSPAPVHRHITITGNRFEQFGVAVLGAKSACHITFTNNAVYAPEKADIRTFLQLDACCDVRIEDNKVH